MEAGDKRKVVSVGDSLYIVVYPASRGGGKYFVGRMRHPPGAGAKQVGMAERWQQPGLLLLGDAAHPMSPIRAQGINLALRDSLVAAEQLLGGSSDLDRAARAIERLRRPEVRAMQRLQRAEARQGHWLGRNRILRSGLIQGRAITGVLAKRVWTARQRPLRDGQWSALEPARLQP